VEHRVVLLEIVARLPQCLVEATQRRATVPGNKPGCIQTIGQVALALHQRQTHQRLNTGEQNFSSVLDVFVIQGRDRTHVSSSRLYCLGGARRAALPSYWLESREWVCHRKITKTTGRYWLFKYRSIVDLSLFTQQVSCTHQ
jgi:hypothetical protein